MRIKFKNFLCIFTGLAAFLGASNADTMFSKYGIIQNVQNYSSNPFWNPNSPYNNRMPQPVYATGPQVKTDECQRIVTSLVTLQCMNANNCIGVELGDIRPAIMLQLSRMTGGNYATACAGYLDGIFNDYVSQFANAAPNGTPSKFPTPAAPNTNANGNQIQLSNPFATPAPDWATDMRERQLELQALHTETGTNNHQIQSAEFPTTYADVSFTDRLENARNGYEPFKDARAYREMDIEDEETYLDRVERIKKSKQEEEKEEEKDQKEQYHPQGEKKSNKGHNPQSEKKSNKGHNPQAEALTQEGEKPQPEQPKQPEQPEQPKQPEQPEQPKQPQVPNLTIPQVETEETKKEPDIKLAGTVPDSIDNQCVFTSDGVGGTQAVSPGTLACVRSTEIITTGEDGTEIRVKAFAYAGCKDMNGNPGGEYCWCARKAELCPKPEGCQESELTKELKLWCQDPLGACADKCAQACAKLLDPPQNQQ